LEESGERQRLLAAHRDHFLQFAEEGSAKANGAEETAWFGRFDAEHGNFRTALEWSKACGDWPEYARMCASLWIYWMVRGLWSEARGWLEAGVANAGQVDPVIYSKLLYQAGQVANYMGDLARARGLLETCVALRRDAGDRKDLSGALCALGGVLTRSREGRRAAAILEEALSVARESDDPLRTGLALCELGLVGMDARTFEEAASYFDEALVIFRRTGATRQIASALHNLGDIAKRQGAYARAEGLVRESLAMAVEAGDRHLIARTVHLLGSVASERGRYDEAAAHFATALEMDRETGDREGVACAVEGFAGVAAAQGRPDRALLLAGAAVAARGSEAALYPPGERVTLERQLLTARSALGDDAAARAFDEGRALTLAQAVSLALGKPATPCRT
jgi:tetratricopeptide (TPR) repeat protein